MLPIKTVGAPTIQGAVVTGMQGCGVKTPAAAVVAEATAGLANELHTPKGGIFAIGLLSMMVAAGVWVNTLFCGVTTNVLGPRQSYTALSHPCILVGP